MPTDSINIDVLFIVIGALPILLTIVYLDRYRAGRRGSLANAEYVAQVQVARCNSALHQVLLILLFLYLPAGCQRKPITDAKPIDQAGQSGSNQNTLSVLDKGDLKLLYQPRKIPKRASTVASNPQVLQQIVANLNDKIALPWDVTISFQDCSEPDAHYDPETHSVTICYQLIDEYYNLFAHKIKDKTKLDDAVRGAVASTFFHELGHGLVDAWKLPVTGKEEDAVDQLSTLVLINNTNNGEQMALDGAISFQLYADLDRGATKIYWDEHSLDEQRFYDIICLIYGHAPYKYSYLVKNGTLPEERAELCQEDYPKVARAWTQLLSPYLKHPPEGTASPAPQDGSNTR